ncbi:MAG: EthD domain-containing protein, partial [Pseudomonadota bacterium]
MIKLINLLIRKPAVSAEDFQEYLRTTRAGLVRGLPEVKQYVQCHTLLSGYRRKTPPPLDGVEEISIDSTGELDSLQKKLNELGSSSEWGHFVDIDRTKSIVTEEFLIKPGAIHENMVKNIELVTRKKSMPLNEFHQYWGKHHGPLAARIESIKRYVQSHTLMSEYENSREPSYDGVAETWFEDTNGMRMSAASPEYAEVRADEKNF